MRPVVTCTSCCSIHTYHSRPSSGPITSRFASWLHHKLDLRNPALLSSLLAAWLSSPSPIRVILCLLPLMIKGSIVSSISYREARSPLNYLTKTKKGQELPSTQSLPKMVETTEVSVGKQTCIYVWVEVYSSYVICNVWRCVLKNVCNKS